MTISASSEWLCIRCGYVHEGEEPPMFCPICQASKKDFFEATEELKLQYAHLLQDKE